MSAAPEQRGAGGSAPDAGGGASAPVSAPDVAAVLQGLRSGVRQRHAEAVTMSGGLLSAGGEDALPAGGGGVAAALLAVRGSEYVQEPVPFSHRARFGRLIVVTRKAVYHLFLKWFTRPLLAQQNAFNQAAARLLQELAAAQERAARETRLLAARLAEAESRLAEVESRVATATTAFPAATPAAAAATTPAAGAPAAPAPDRPPALPSLP